MAQITRMTHKEVTAQFEMSEWDNLKAGLKGGIEMAKQTNQPLLVQKLTQLLQSLSPAPVVSRSPFVLRQTWDVKALSLRQRDVLILLCNTNTGAVCLDARAPNFRLQLKAARELHQLGIVEVHPPQSRYRDDDEVTVLLTADGEAWLGSLPEGALTILTSDD